MTELKKQAGPNARISPRLTPDKRLYKPPGSFHVYLDVYLDKSSVACETGLVWPCRPGRGVRCKFLPARRGITLTNAAVSDTIAGLMDTTASPDPGLQGGHTATHVDCRHLHM